jgi:hypothetical protein
VNVEAVSKPTAANKLEIKKILVIVVSIRSGKNTQPYSTTEDLRRKMSFSNPRPKWWLLYLALPLLIALFMVDHRMRLSPHGHIAFQLGILLLVYGLVYGWLKANAIALRKMV